MIRDDYDQVDVDAPIPYTITAKGRRDLELAIAEEQMAHCAHAWEVDLGRGFICRRCGAEQLPRRSSIPSYVHRK